MIYSLQGNLIAKKENFIVLNVGGVCYKLFIDKRTAESLPVLEEKLHIFSYLNVKEDALDLYGFLSETELVFFEKLLTVNGVGPKTALGVMALAPVEQLAMAINEGRLELLTRASGIGKKTAERVILELKGKLAVLVSASTLKQMESNIDLEEALVGLGYSRYQVKKISTELNPELKTIEEKLKAALRLLKKN